MPRNGPAEKKAAKKAARPDPSNATSRSRSPSSRAGISTIDDYLARVSGDARAALERLRKTIRSIVPGAEECISYGLAAFRLHGVVIAGFSATKKGCSYYPFSGSTLRTLGAELGGYEKTKSALHFRTDRPLPVALVRTLIKTRVAEIA